MGFIKDNINSFEVYLTDLGKQKFFDGGLKDAVTYYSIIDSDSNYDIFIANENFNPTVISQQPISTINHAGTYKTSLGNGDPDSDDFIGDVFVQVPLRGNKVDNIVYRRALFGTKHNSQKSYVMYEPTQTTEELQILTYIKIDG